MDPSVSSIVPLCLRPADGLEIYLGWAQEEVMRWSWCLGGLLRGRT